MKNSSHLSLRVATQEDEALYLQWANDAEVRYFSFNQNLVNSEEHHRWFAKKLISTYDFLYVFYDEANSLVGQVRIEDSVDAIIGLSVDASHRGKGYACEMIKMGCDKYFSLHRKKSIYALVKFENTASIKAFEKARFVLFQKNEKEGYSKYKIQRDERF